MRVIDKAEAAYGFTVTTIELGELGPKEIWDTRNEWNAYVALSKEIWEQMTEDRRDGVVIIVKDAIERLYNKTEEWLPEALASTESGRYLDVYFRILFTDVDTEVEREIEANSFRVKETFQDARKELDELRREAEEDELQRAA